MSIGWQDVPATELSAAQLHDVLRLRSRIFVVEQECAYQDVDGLDLDPRTWHVLGLHHGELVAYARILRDTPAGPHSAAVEGRRIGRVAVDASVRGRQIGRALVQRCLERCRIEDERTGGSGPIVLSAQAHLVDFYASLGFVTTGDPYDEDGIMHVEMRLTP